MRLMANFDTTCIDIDLDSKVISVIWNIRFNLLTTRNHCVKFEYPPSKMKEEFLFWALRQFLSIFDLDLWLQGHIGNQEYSLSSTHYYM